jgi:transcription antitermination protein NusB
MSGAKPARAADRKLAKPSARRVAREFVLQALYQWQLAGQDFGFIEKQFAEADDFGQADKGFFSALLKSSIAHAEATRDALVPHLDRAWDELSPIERGILLLSGHELLAAPDVPYRVVINEAIELAKRYGGTDGHKYVNGVLDKLAAAARPEEIALAAASGATSGGSRRPAA